jgi:hypothetical protein
MVQPMSTRPGHGAARPSHGAARPSHGAARPGHGAARTGHGAARTSHGAARTSHCRPLGRADCCSAPPAPVRFLGLAAELLPGYASCETRLPWLGGWRQGASCVSSSSPELAGCAGTAGPLPCAGAHFVFEVGLLFLAARDRSILLVADGASRQ